MATAISCPIKSKDPSNQIINVDPNGLVVRALLFWKADPSIADSHGETPLHVAAQRQNMQIYNELFVSLTLLHGGKFAENVVATQQNRMGATPGKILEEQRALAKHRSDAKNGADQLP